MELGEKYLISGTLTETETFLNTANVPKCTKTWESSEVPQQDLAFDISSND